MALEVSKIHSSTPQAPDNFVAMISIHPQRECEPGSMVIAERLPRSRRSDLSGTIPNLAEKTSF